MKSILPISLSLLAGVLFPASGDDIGPTLEVLPLNSTLSDVTIPRYDSNRRRVAYLKADLMEILADGEPVNNRQPIMVDCTGIQLRMNSEQTGGDISVDMKRARYRLTPGVLSVQESITARSPKFSLMGNGGVFHLDTQRGFLFGPVDCKVYQLKTAYHSDMPTPVHAFLVASSLATLSPSSYQPPNTIRLLEVARQATPSSPRIQSEQTEVTQSAEAHEKDVEIANLRLAQFSEDVDSKSLNLLIQNPPPANPPSQVRPPLENPDLEIHCDGGCFFDGNENLLVLLRNVVVNESRFTLKAQEEIKVFFLSEPSKEKKEGEEKKENSDSGPKLNLTEVKSLVASGGIHFSGVDKNGNPVEASAATAFYDDKKKELILKDGQPTFWTKKGDLELHLQAENANASVRIELAGETMSAHTSPNGWKIGGKNLPFKK